MVGLPLLADDPVERLQTVHTAVLASRELQASLGPDTLSRMVSFAPPRLLTSMSRLYSGWHLARWHPPIINLIVSNVPGPPVDLYCAGARIGGLFPMGPLIEGVGLNLTVLSEAHHLNVGVMACPELVDDVDELGAGFVAAVDDLAGRVPTTRPRAGSA